MSETDTTVEVCLDYIRFTAGRENNIDELLNRGVPSLSRTGDILNYGSYGYDRTCPLIGGGRIMFHTEDHGMKYCVELSGKPLEEMRREGFSDEIVIGHAFSGKVARVAFTRVDVAFDVKGSDGTIDEVYESWKKKETTSLARTVTYVESVKSEFRANTVYFGARETTPRLVRMYDKRAQLRKEGSSWLRMEGEIKKRRATPFAWSVLKNGTASAGRRELKDAIKTRVAWVVAALTGEIAEKTEVPRSEAHPNEYVKKMIIPFIKNHHGELTQETKAMLLMAVEDYITLT